ncbi:MAG: Hsp33 family molecular chaperone [Hyphomicrobiales bacterium]|nr:Hsp33 family molecular chaperone [Hyphomicrobiales bacterium]
MSDAGPAFRPISDAGADDVVIPFAVTPLDVRGRLVRLGPALDVLLANHGYPGEIARAVGEAAALTALLGSSLKFEGRFQLQTRSDGVIDMLVVDFDAPDRLRAFARFDPERLAAAREAGATQPALLFGKGHLALTIDQGPDTSRYQGIVTLEGQGLEAAAHEYFLRSEQIPTLVRLAVAEVVSAGDRPAHWRAGGLLLQFLPDSPERQRMQDLHPGDRPESAGEPEFREDDAWMEAQALAATVEDHELVDPALSSDRLLYRLFHERGVTVFDASALRHACRCSRDGIERMLRGFTTKERADMIGEDGRIGVTCEFCGVKREFEPGDFDGGEPEAGQ